MNIFMFVKVLTFVTIVGWGWIGVSGQLQVLQLIRRQYHDGVLFEDYASDSASVRYSITSGQGWDNLETLAKEHELTGKAMFCSTGPGTWLLYPDANFGITSKHTLKILYGELCVPVDDVMSLQPVGAFQSKTNRVTVAAVFSEKYFASPIHTIRNGSEVPAAIKSAIFLGDGNYTIVAGEGKKICVANVGMDGDLCLIEDVEGAFSTTAISIEPECEEGEDIDFYGLQSCYQTGYREIIYEPDFGMEGMQKICGGEYDTADPAKDKFLNVMKVWQYRVQGNDIKDTGPALTEAQQIKLNVLDGMMDIVDKTCDNLDAEYLTLILEIFRNFHLKRGLIWQEEPQNGTDYDSIMAQWLEASIFIKNCHASAQAPLVVFNTRCEGPKYTRNDRLHVLENFLNGEKYDFIIEQFYLIISYVSTYCYNQLGTMDNTWGEMPFVFKDGYLYPLRKQWKDPGPVATYYPLMLNGFDMEEEKKSLVNCLQEIVLRTPFYDPLARPPEFFEGENSTVAEGVGKPGGEMAKDGRRKRQQMKESVEMIESTNALGSGMPSKPATTTTTQSPKVKSSTTAPSPPLKKQGGDEVETKKKITTTTTRVTTTTSATTTTTLSPPSTPVEVSATEVPETTELPEGETERPASKKRGKKKKPKRKKGKKGKKKTKLRRKNKEEE